VGELMNLVLKKSTTVLKVIALICLLGFLTIPQAKAVDLKNPSFFQVKMSLWAEGIFDRSLERIGERSDEDINDESLALQQEKVVPEELIRAMSVYEQQRNIF
jgi:hypothetical protein